MMVNAQTMTGAILYTTSGLDNASIDIPTPTPSGYPNFMLLFATAQEIGSKVGSFRARQDQLFTCTF
jgi:hypothetical protein